MIKVHLDQDGQKKTTKTRMAELEAFRVMPRKAMGIPLFCTPRIPDHVNRLSTADVFCSEEKKMS